MNFGGVKRQLHFYLDRQPDAAARLIQAIDDGRVRGDKYAHECCACVMGHLAQVALGYRLGEPLYYDEQSVVDALACDLASLQRNDDRLSALEAYITDVQPGDTAETNHALKSLRKWVVDWQDAQRLGGEA